jgi:hypothetical protein
MSAEQEQMDQFERLLELRFLRERRKEMKRRLESFQTTLITVI